MAMVQRSAGHTASALSHTSRMLRRWSRGREDSVDDVNTEKSGMAYDGI